MYNPFRNEDVGKLVMRFTLGSLMLFHGIPKVMSGGSLSWIGGQLAELNLPATLAYGVYLGEVVGPLLIIFGLWCRWGAALIVIDMVFAIALAHSSEIFTLSSSGAWALELQGFYLFTALSLVFLGSGGYAFRSD